MIDGNFDDFDRFLEDVVERKLAEWYSRVVRKIALDLLGRVVRATPVDTGRARFGWDVTLLSPSGWAPPEGAERYPANDIQRALGALASIRFGDEVWIVNNVVYISRLNDGWSDQQPAGFVEAALQAMEMVLNAA